MIAAQRLARMDAGADAAYPARAPYTRRRPISDLAPTRQRPTVPPKLLQGLARSARPETRPRASPHLTGLSRLPAGRSW